MTLERTLARVFAEYDEADVGAPDREGFVRDLVRRDRLRLARRSGLVAFSGAAAITVALAFGSTNKGSLHVVPATRPDTATTTTWPSTVTTTTPASTPGTAGLPGAGTVPPATAPSPTDTTPPPTDTPPDESIVTTTTTAEGAHEWTAYNTYGEGAGDPPFENFYGTAAPGTVVTASTGQGGGTNPISQETTADASGNWSLRMYFPDAQVGHVFQIKLYPDSDVAAQISFGYRRTG